MTDKVETESLPKCGCGKSLHMPHCDGSHGRSPEQLEAWKLEVEAKRKAEEGNA